MKRFYETVDVAPGDGGTAVHLDGRPARTPRERPLALPSRALAEAVAREWSGQGADIDLSAMRLTRLANTAIDRVADDREAVISEILRYGETDLVCYRADRPADLRRAQCAAWDPLVAWMRERHGVVLDVTDGILPVPQPPGSLARIRELVAVQRDFPLTATHALAGICGSVVLALALAWGRISAAEAWEASRLDENRQLETWGRDGEAEARGAELRADLEAAAAFMALAGDGR